MTETTPSQDGESLDPSAVDPTRSLRSTLRGVASVVAPASIVTALLYYFGWARTDYEARLLGLHGSLLGYSTQDYLLNSMSSLYTPIAFGVVALLAGLAVHVGVVTWADKATTGPQQARRRVLALRVLTAFLAIAAVVLLVLGEVGARDSEPSRFVSLYGPVAFIVGIVFAGYALHVGRRFLTRGPARPSTPERTSLGLVSASLYLVLLFLSLFNAVSHYAAIKGGDLAEVVVQNMQRLPDATLYSTRRLYLQPPVIETELGQDTSSYRFKYTGLKFLFVSGHQYFLRPSDTETSNVNIIVPEGPDLRLDLAEALAGSSG